MMRLHATCISVNGHGVLLQGAPGRGKSDLALRLIDGGARLVADDQVLLEQVGDQVIASAPPAIAGLLEVRGVGIMRLPHAPAPVTLAVDLDGAPERLPEAASIALLDRAVPLLRLNGREPSAPAKIRVALAGMRAGQWPS